MSMSRSRWGRLVTLAYMLACVLALAAMLVETVMGHAGIATMFAAILAAPWSMLVAGLAPPLPHDWPMAAGLAVRMIPLALFMLLNAAIVRGIASRAERDLARTVTTAVVLAFVALVPSGCRLMSRQEVFVGAPTQALQFLNGGKERTECYFDLTTSPQWVDQHGHIARITGLTIMGDFQNLTGSPVDVKIAVAPDSLPPYVQGVDTWGPVRVDSLATRRVEWTEGERLMNADVSTLERELRGNGKFTLYTITSGLDGSQSSSEVKNLRLAAVFELE